MIRLWLIAMLFGLMGGVAAAAPNPSHSADYDAQDFAKCCETDQGDSLKVQFSGVLSSDGKLLIEIRNPSGEPILGLQIPASPNAAGEQTVAIPLDLGTYAIAAFHDRNDNGDIDFNWFGAPTERYGFSNDARGLFSEPDLKDQLFKFSSTDGVHRIHLH